jgi:hypothetical protein
LGCRHERTLKRRLAGKPYNFSGLLKGANERGRIEQIGRKQYLLWQFQLLRGKWGGGQKQEGDFSCEISPSLLRFSEIRFGFQITMLVIPESLGTHELQPVLLPHSSVVTLAAKAFLLPSFSSYPDRASLPILEDDC